MRREESRRAVKITIFILRVDLMVDVVVAIDLHYLHCYHYYP